MRFDRSACTNPKILTFFFFLVFQRLDAEKRQLVLRYRFFWDAGHREDGEGVPRCLGLRLVRL